MELTWDADWKAQYDGAGLARVSNQLVSLARSSIRFVTGKSNDEEIPVGNTKIGGSPDLPQGVQWPEWKSEPLTFLVQINLKDIASLHAASELPPSGLLSFFYHHSQPWGFDPKDEGGWRVIYSEDLIDLERMPLPQELPEEARFSAGTLSFFEELTLPSRRLMDYWDLGLTEQEERRYADFLELIEPDKNRLINRILGYPDLIQGDIFFESQLVSHGIYCGDAKAHLHPDYGKWLPDAKDWRLLLQLDSEMDFGMMWGDVGRVYFSMQKDALKNKEFEKAWLTFQCS